MVYIVIFQILCHRRYGQRNRKSNMDGWIFSSIMPELQRQSDHADERSRFDRVIEVNLKGAFNTIHAAARQMIRQKSGKS